MADSSYDFDFSDADYPSTDEEGVSTGITRANDGSNVPLYDHNVWIISCRRYRSMSQFASQVLLFQPDTRLFCHKGNACLIQHPDHMARYCHRIPVPQPCLATHSNPHAIPLVQQTYELTADLDFLNSGDLASRCPTGKNIIIYVHGHRTRYYRAIAVLDHIRSICRDDKSLKLRDYIVMGFVWPCHSKKISYSLARAKVPQVAVILRNSILALQKAGNVVDAVISHSMGTRVALAALDSSIPDRSSPAISKLFLLAAAVSRDALYREYLITNITARYIYNIFSNDDDVLASGFGWGELVSSLAVSSHIFGYGGEALGLRGAVLPEDLLRDISDRFTDVDVSQDVHNHSIHAYLCSKGFLFNFYEESD